MTPPVLIGLTGSIGMGKSTTAQMFRDAGIPVWDADAAVHRLYGAGGAAVAPIAALRPNAVQNGAVDRGALKDWIASDPSALAAIEQVVHPLVAADRHRFVADQIAPIIVLDIPLLFETNGQSTVDVVAVVSTDSDEQRARVLARPGMTQALFDTILAKQTPDREKRRLADAIIDTSSPESARRDVHALITQIQQEMANA